MDRWVGTGKLLVQQAKEKKGKIIKTTRRTGSFEAETINRIYKQWEDSPLLYKDLVCLTTF